MAIKTCLMIGGSGMAGGWINRLVNEFSDQVKIIGLADIQQEVLDQQTETLGLGKDQLFT
ncbi:TPA: oxidoreductase, partial [Candidatus Poribacteria bacterium]|nr:oxidoreductase [Candidatus Poribacteria bacterium]